MNCYVIALALCVVGACLVSDADCAPAPDFVKDNKRQFEVAKTKCDGETQQLQYQDSDHETGDSCSDDDHSSNSDDCKDSSESDSDSDSDDSSDSKSKHRKC